jgi:hypothetical protein
MNTKFNTSIFKPLVFTAAWLFGIAVIRYVGNIVPVSPGVDILVGWLFALLIGMLIKMDYKSVLPACGLFFVVAIAEMLFKTEWFYGEATSISRDYIVILSVLLLLFVSPLLAAIELRKLISKWNR